MKRCPHCNAIVATTDIKCWKCGAEIPPEMPTPSAEFRPPSPVFRAETEEMPDELKSEREPPIEEEPPYQPVVIPRKPPQTGVALSLGFEKSEGLDEEREEIIPPLPPKYVPRLGEVEEPSQAEVREMKERPPIRTPTPKRIARPSTPSPVPPSTEAFPRPYRPRPVKEEEKPPIPSTPWKRYNIGTFISLVGMILLISSLFLPWYTVQMSSDYENGKEPPGEEPAWYTNGSMKQVALIDGYHPIDVDLSPFMGGKNGSDGGDPLEGIPVPLGVFWIIGLCITLSFRTMSNKPWIRGKRYIKNGIEFFVVLIIFLVIIWKFHTAIPDSPAKQMMEIVGDRPLGGEEEADIQDWRVSDWGPEAGNSTEDYNLSVKFIWGVQVGMILYIISASMVLVGGIVEYVIGDKLRKSLEEQRGAFPFIAPREGEMAIGFRRRRRMKTR